MLKSLYYPVNTDIFETYLAEKGFNHNQAEKDDKDIPLIEVGQTVHKKGDIFVRVPHAKNLSEKQVKDLLRLADLTLADFEAYMDHIKATRLFDIFIEQSLKSSSLKKK